MTTLHFHGFPAPSRPVFLLFVFVRDGFGQHAGEDGGGIGVRMDGNAPRGRGSGTTNRQIKNAGHCVPSF